MTVMNAAERLRSQAATMATPTTKDEISNAEAKESLDRIAAQNRAVERAAQRHLSAAEAAKEAKRAWEAERDRLSELIADLTTPLPLFAEKAPDVAQDAAGATDASPDPDAWRDEKVAVLGLPDAIVDALWEGAEIETLGELDDCLDEDLGGGDICGLNGNQTDRVRAALRQYRDLRNGKVVDPHIQPMAEETDERRTLRIEETDLTAADFSGTCSADTIGGKTSSIRRVLTIGGVPYAHVATGYSAEGAPPNRATTVTAELCRIVPFAEWSGPSWDRIDARPQSEGVGDYYRGIRVACGGQKYVLAGRDGRLSVEWIEFRGDRPPLDPIPPKPAKPKRGRKPATAEARP